MPAPHTSTRYALLRNYTIVAIHSMSDDGDEWLVSETTPNLYTGLAYLPARLVYREEIWYLFANYKAAVAARTEMRERDRNGESK